MISVRDDTATTTCPVCGTGFEPEGRQRFCSTACRQQAWKAEIVAVAHALADAARVATLLHFRADDLVADTKEALRFDPVTVADRLSEERMRAILAERRPQDGILGEEFGATEGTSGLTWVLDPIDGTRGYLSGTPTWGVLISVRDATGPLFGIIDQPYIQERFEGGFGRAMVNGPMGQKALRCRPIRAPMRASR